MAYDAGIRKGDKILAVNDQSFRFYDEFTNYLAAHSDSKLKTTVLRGKRYLEFCLRSGIRGENSVFISDRRRYRNWPFMRYSFLEAIPAGIDRGTETLGSYLKQLKLLFSPM